MIENQHLTAECYEAWKPGDVAFIYSLHFDVVVHGESTLLLLTLVQPRIDGTQSWPLKDGKWFEVSIRFWGVRDLQLKKFGPGPKQVMGFSMEDIKARGWEGVALSVEDYEDGAISFVCTQARIESVNVAQNPPFAQCSTT